MTDLTICQNCKQVPATYGDGLTWARCSDCQYQFNKSSASPKSQEPVVDSSESFEHKTIAGFTSIIMPVYINNYPLFHYTGNAIGSVREHTPKEDYELIVVDNGSTVKPPNLQAYYADKVIVNDKNEGVTKAWNKGIRASFGEYIVLLNNDTQVFEGWLSDMKEALISTDLVMSHPMYSLTEPFARAFESKSIREKWLTKPIEDSFSDFKDFSCVMFKKQLINEIGLFDEDFFSYASDVEFRDRMDRANKKYVCCERVAIHHISDATGYSIPETPEIMNKDKETYEKKKSIVPEVQKVEPVTSPNQSGQASSGKVVSQVNNLVRTKETGDKIFLIKDNKANWVRNPDVLRALGFNFGQEKTITREEFLKFERGQEINMENYTDFKNGETA